MTKKIKNYIKFILFTFILYIFVFNPNIIINSITYSLNIFINKLFPSLFPFFILSDILINYNYLNYLYKLIPLKYFNIILLSMLSGLPSNAKYIKNLLDNNLIDIQNASLILSFTYFPNPMFIISSVGITLLNNKLLGMKILIIIYLSNLIFYLFNYKKLNYINININKKNYNALLKESIINSLNTLFIILGNISIFIIIINIIKHYFVLNNILLSIINGLIEITSGSILITNLTIPTKFKCILLTSIFSFSGLSIISQSLSILNNYKLNTIYIIKNKIIIMLISILLSLILF